MISLADILKEIKPYVLRWVGEGSGGPGPYAPTPHALSSSHHTGTLSDAQGPQFLLTNGSRTLTGNLTVTDGATIDGVDISVHAANGSIHHVSGMAQDDHSQYVHVSTARSIQAVHSFSPPATNPPFLIGGNAAGQTVFGLKADMLNKTITAGSGLTGGGALDLDRSFAINWGNPTITTIQPDDSASAGSSENPARSDHQHAIGAGVPISIVPADGPMEGTATSFARSDHQHAILTATPLDITPDVTSYVGAALSFARSDHRHGMLDGVPTTIQPDDVTEIGTAAGFSRYDHRHAIVAAAPLSDSVNVNASTPGVATSFARSDHTHNLDENIAAVWTNDHTFEGNITARHVQPQLTDTYDLGSSTKLWRKGWLSELDAILFAQNTITLLGGWFMVTKAEGTVIADFPNGETEISISIENLPSGDIIVLRNSLQVEYVRLDTYDGSNVYFVTRDLDGSGQNDWPAGTVFAVLGQAGDGRIELNAYDSPRIQILSQGSAYNLQTELIRLGDLNGNWGYTGQAFGIAMGEYAPNKANLTWDPANGLRIRTYTSTVIQLDNAGNADITGKLRLPGTNSALAIGATPPAAYNSGTGLWLDRTGLYSLLSNVYQVKIDAVTGKFYAGGGKVEADVDGISLLEPSGGSANYTSAAAILFKDNSGDKFGVLRSYYNASEQWLLLQTTSYDYRGAGLRFAASNPSGLAQSLSYCEGVSSTRYSQIAHSCNLYSAGNTTFKEAQFSLVGRSVSSSHQVEITGLAREAAVSGGSTAYTDQIEMAINGASPAQFVLANDALQLNCDLYTTKWVDWNSSVSVGGFSSFTSKVFWYMKIGKLVRCAFRFEGVSNANSLTFTLPESVSSTTMPTIRVPVLVTDGGMSQIGYLRIPHYSSYDQLIVYPGPATSTWATSGNKAAQGEFWYLAD
ncbi:MAG: hypothetical protein ACOYYS_19705 [Chloroflexota bacterium]